MTKLTAVEGHLQKGQLVRGAKLRASTLSGLDHDPGQVGKLDRGQAYAPKTSRRYAPGFRQKQGLKGPKFSGATRRNLSTNRAKRPKMFRRYAPGDPPPDFPTHIKYVSTVQPCFPTWIN